MLLATAVVVASPAVRAQQATAALVAAETVPDMLAARRVHDEDASHTSLSYRLRNAVDPVFRMIGLAIARVRRFKEYTFA
jgi:hypothetical protein